MKVQVKGFVICGAEPTHGHHIVKQRLGGVETVELCPLHHKQADLGKIDMDQLWKLRDERLTIQDLMGDTGQPSFDAWETDRHSQAMGTNGWHDLYNEEYGVALYGEMIKADRRFWRQCMVSLWPCGEARA